jgi:hypothetical protein
VKGKGKEDASVSLEHQLVPLSPRAATDDPDHRSSFGSATSALDLRPARRAQEEATEEVAARRLRGGRGVTTDVRGALG